MANKKLIVEHNNFPKPKKVRCKIKKCIVCGKRPAKIGSFCHVCDPFAEQDILGEYEDMLPLSPK